MQMSNYWVRRSVRLHECDTETLFIHCISFDSIHNAWMNFLHRQFGLALWEEMRGLGAQLKRTSWFFVDWASNQDCPCGGILRGDLGIDLECPAGIMYSIRDCESLRILQDKLEDVAGEKVVRGFLLGPLPPWQRLGRMFGGIYRWILSLSIFSPINH